MLWTDNFKEICNSKMGGKKGFVGIRENRCAMALFSLLINSLGIKAYSEHIHEQIYKIPCIISYSSQMFLEIISSSFPVLLWML